MTSSAPSGDISENLLKMLFEYPNLVWLLIRVCCLGEPLFHLRFTFSSVLEGSWIVCELSTFDIQLDSRRDHVGFHPPVRDHAGSGTFPITSVSRGGIGRIAS